jgi:hypothetical protein
MKRADSVEAPARPGKATPDVRRVASRISLLATSLSVAAALAAGLFLVPASAANGPARAPASAPQRIDPDVLLLDVYRDLAANRLRDALAKSESLVQAYPNFQLGQLIHGDLLLMQTHVVTGFGKAAGGAPDKLSDLRQEATARLRSLRERPAADLVPRAVMQLRDDQKNVLVIDTKRSRLFLYENRRGELHLVKDYYFSQGKYGVDKFKEGDGKTPLGVYYITSRLAGSRLPDFYGAGALPISYPNEWDKLQGRGGSGIWLHGTPSGNFSRPPLASDGCVVLTNPDLNELYATVEVLKTPVVISDKVEFIPRAKAAAERLEAEALVKAWQADLVANGVQRNHYSARFKSESGETLDAWLARQPKPLAGATLALRDVSFFHYPGQDNLIVGTFTQDARNGRAGSSVRKRQYWAREGQVWKIISESSWPATIGLKNAAIPADAAASPVPERLKSAAYVNEFRATEAVVRNSARQERQFFPAGVAAYAAATATGFTQSGLAGASASALTSSYVVATAAAAALKPVAFEAGAGSAGKSGAQPQAIRGGDANTLYKAAVGTAAAKRDAQAADRAEDARPVKTPVKVVAGKPPRSGANATGNRAQRLAAKPVGKDSDLRTATAKAPAKSTGKPVVKASTRQAARPAGKAAASPVNRASANRASANRASANRASANRAPAGAASANRTSASRTSANKVPAVKTSANRTSANKASAKKT